MSAVTVSILLVNFFGSAAFSANTTIAVGRVACVASHHKK